MAEREREKGSNTTTTASRFAAATRRSRPLQAVNISSALPAYIRTHATYILVPLYIRIYTPPLLASEKPARERRKKIEEEEADDDDSLSLSFYFSLRPLFIARYTRTQYRESRARATHDDDERRQRRCFYFMHHCLIIHTVVKFLLYIQWDDIARGRDEGRETLQLAEQQPFADAARYVNVVSAARQPLDIPRDEKGLCCCCCCVLQALLAGLISCI